MQIPEFPAHYKWLNTSQPHTLKELKGNIVILDFWTYCCINCLHILKDLEYLEKKYDHQALTIIGVHSAKFENEQDIANIQSAIERYNIKHPVLVDEHHSYWQQLTIKAWPTLVVIGPDGHITKTFTGEGHLLEIETLINQLLTHKDISKKGAHKKAALVPSKSSSVLNFPAKLALDDKNHQLFISDSNHNSILQVELVTPFEGKIRKRIGSSLQNFMDGSTSEGSFNKPQGLFYESDKLYICDTDNHAIRMIDLNTNHISTLAGVGTQAAWGSLGGRAIDTQLNSPWDITKINNKLYIAMAGAHAIWCYDFTTQEIHPFAGSGIENIRDGTLDEAQLAQPSGISHGENCLFVADSEGSAIRQIDLAKKEVMTIIGLGLFDFGHVDGQTSQALLQHPMGLCYWQELLFIADTYNHSLRMLDIKSKQILSLIYRDPETKICQVGPKECHLLPLNEPNDVKVLEDRYLYIADTNNHLIRVFDLHTKELHDLVIS